MLRRFRLAAAWPRLPLQPLRHCNEGVNAAMAGDHMIPSQIVTNCTRNDTDCFEGMSLHSGTFLRVRTSD